ncbi:hypothetical protein CBER1_03238 [Cercospora berteroae]|uniref:peptidylprolyl isomerase n=1 Tax=Cercospora berteroae TaxID=357750 RepID=A0A2S6C2D0_9PEZI|nr:hypothetical protein CBER1_03238 [Cercospora berteroae]
MAGMLPMALYGLEVPAGDVAIPARPDIPSAYRITMAAIDPSAEPEGEEGQPARATLKIIRQALTEDYSDDEDEEDFDIEELERMLGEQGDSDEDSDEEEANGGPSDPAKSKAARKAAAQKAIEQLIAEQDDDDMDVDEKPNGVNGKKSAKALGKRPATDDEDSDDEEIDSDDEEEYEEFVICTLDPEKHYQQPLDITVGENERVLFKVSGTHSIFLTGNYVQPADEHSHEHGMYDPDSDEEDEYDLEPDSDELDEYDEEDELDDMEDPRITELDDEDEAPALIEAKSSKADKKGKNKRLAEDETADGSAIDELIANAAKKEGANGEKLSKKQLKKLKKNDGTAIPADEVAKKEAEAPGSTKSDKKVSFAKELEQGPTPTKDAKKDKASTGPRTVSGVKIDDRKVGSGPAAKAGDRVGMRYIGKLEKDNKVFDSNKKGKPFSFKLGSGEVIKGWDIGIAGMSAGGERRITIPAHLAYGSRGAPPSIPGNATLVFDVKLLEINKK